MEKIGALQRGEQGALEAYVAWLERFDDPRSKLASATESEAPEIRRRAGVIIEPPMWAASCTLTWRRGFIDTATCSLGRYGVEGSMGFLRRFIRHPSCHVLRELTFAAPTPRYGSGETSPGHLWRRVLERDAPPTLKRVSAINQGVALALEGLPGIEVVYTPLASARPTGGA